jgi:Cu/Ag efflux protein CusF
MTKKLTATLLSWSIALLLTGPALAADDSKAAATSETLQGTVIVQSVDIPNRLVTVEDSAGQVQTLEVPPTAKNFSQLKAGDRITIRYKVGVAAEIKVPEDPSKISEVRESVTSTPPGAKPGGKAQRTVTTFITVKAVDLEKNTLTFEGPKQRTRTIAVKAPKMQDLLKRLKPGDQVEVAYTEALAIDVQAAQ